MALWIVSSATACGGAIEENIVSSARAWEPLKRTRQAVSVLGL